MTAAIAAARARARRSGRGASTIDHSRAGMANESAVMRVRDAAASRTPSRAAFRARGSRRIRTNAHALNVTTHANRSSRQPPFDQSMTAQSIAKASAAKSPIGGENAVAPSRYVANTAATEAEALAKLMPTS